MTSDIRVTKCNHLIEASYRLSLNEQRLILLAIAKLDSRKPVSQNNNFVITAFEFAEKFDIPQKQAYEALQDATIRLYERNIKTFNKNAKTRDQFRWVDAVRYWDGDAKVTLSFSSYILPYLTQIHTQFTSYEFKQITRLKTAYSIRFYEILIQFNKTGKKFITLEKMRETFELDNEYPRFYDLKKRIIDPSINEINLNTNLTVEWSTIKKGKTITGLCFSFKEKRIISNENNKIIPMAEHTHQQQSLNALSGDQNHFRLPTTTIEKAKELIRGTRIRWDVYAIEEQFYDYSKKVGIPKNKDAAFLGFVRKKITCPP